MNQLIDIMIEKKILTNKTVITVIYQIKNNFGGIIKKQDSFVFNSVTKQGNDYNLLLKTVSGDTFMNVLATDIVAIDGMKPDRIIDVYNINIDGTSKKIGKKRGRRSKTLI